MAIRTSLCQAKQQRNNSSQPPRYVFGLEDLPKIHLECTKGQETPLFKMTHSSHLLMDGLLGGFFSCLFLKRLIRADVCTAVAFRGTVWSSPFQLQCLKNRKAWNKTNYITIRFLWNVRRFCLQLTFLLESHQAYYHFNLEWNKQGVFLG